MGFSSQGRAIACIGERTRRIRNSSLADSRLPIRRLLGRWHATQLHNTFGSAMPWVNRMLHGYKVVIDPAEEALASSSAVRSAPERANVDARPGQRAPGARDMTSPRA